MASLLVRTERSGSIFNRITGLIRAGKMKWADRPLWYDVYSCHPPINEPIWDLKMPKSDEPLRKIFYREDIEYAESFRSTKEQLELMRKRKNTRAASTPLGEDILGMS